MRHRIETRWFVLFKEDAGVISEGEVWVFWLYGGGCWMYCDDTLPKTLWLVLRFWKDDRFLVG